MDLDNAELCFSQAPGTPIMGRPLAEALRQLIGKATQRIVICSCEFTSKTDFILNEEITKQLRKGREVLVYGNHSGQMSQLKAAYGEMGLRAFHWVQPRRGSLFHIKAITVDGNRAYIGSANLSKNAMVNSAEWGVIAHSPDLCRDLDHYIDQLHSQGRFKEL